MKLAADNKSLTLKLHRLVGAVNAKALLVDEDSSDLPEHVIGLALAARRLTEDEKSSTEIDFISGFHFWDRRVQILVLEGVAAKGIARLWADLTRMMEEEEEGQPEFAVFYNSTITFAEVCVPRGSHGGGRGGWW